MKYCTECGAPNDDQSKYCDRCGKDLDEMQKKAEVLRMVPKRESDKYSGLAIAALIVSLVGLIVFAIICGPISIIFSIVAIVEIKQKKRKGFGMAVAGLVIGVIDIVSYFVLMNMFM